MRQAIHSTAILGSVAAFLLVASVAGQERRPATPADELLTEVRALRADMNNAAKSQMRAQLLGIRLQLQEQRIGVVSRQLADVQEGLRANAQTQTALAVQLKAFPWAADVAPQDEAAQGFAQILAPFKAHQAELERADQRLKNEEADLQRLLAVEQSRWAGFNAQIEELERAAAAPPR